MLPANKEHVYSQSNTNANKTYPRLRRHAETEKFLLKLTGRLLQISFRITVSTMFAVLNVIRGTRGFDTRHKIVALFL
jgi:hypothetical protein